jgi:anaerobic magnesium-protoporphyrin IX monomethyl ester cyclase
MKILYLPSCRSQQRQFQNTKVNIYPVYMAMEAEWYRKHGHEVIWGMPTKNEYIDKVVIEPEGIEFLDLPRPDRVFTRAMDKCYQDNGNFKYLPGTYIQSAKGCWWGKCTFCVEKKSHYYRRSVSSVIEEIKECKALGYKEIFDDAGTFSTDDWWLDEFLTKLTPISKGIRFSCNMRMVDIDYALLRHSGFRMVLFGVESANQQTLDIINKGVKCEDIKYIKKASEAGLEPHVAVMFGFPGESDKDAINTLRLVHYLLTRGYAKTAQASFYNHAGECSQENHRRYVRKLYDVWKNPRFWFNKIRDIHNVDDLKYLWRAIKKGVSRG